MHKSSDVLDRLSYLTGNSGILKSAPTTPVKALFDPLVTDFFDELSHALLKDSEAKKLSDVIAWAFWIRKASLKKEMPRYEGKNRLGRGVAFHIAPSNVPVNFAVTMTSSLLAGNITVVRVSNKDFIQVRIIVKAINELLDTDRYQVLKNYLVIVRYDHDKEINDYLSSICDLRVVWGGNETVYELRQSQLPVRAVEMAFPDRYSVAVINADEYLKADPKKIAWNFYVDTYFTDQNACSSPRIIVWTGSHLDEAKERFFSALKEQLNISAYKMASILAVDKLNALCELASAHSDLEIRRESSDNELVRIKVNRLFDDLLDYKCAGGYFFEYDTDNLEDLLCLFNKPCQTISYYGVAKEELLNLVLKHGVRGVDRIVPLGRTMELEFFWDGYDMIETMSRNVDVSVI
ncbi:MAG: acyl-CoA reductase [Succinivibrio sp.]